MRTMNLLIMSLYPFLVFSQTADVVYTNAKVWTGDKSKPQAETIAIFNGKILAVGTHRTLEGYISPKTKIFDLHGKLLLPGFIDDHTHFMSGGFQLQSVNLRYADSEQEFSRLIKERTEKYPKRWITGGDWDHDRWKGGHLPTKELINNVTSSTPVFVNRYDGHMALEIGRAHV